MYRKGRPLADLIPPDRRRLHAAALVLGGMIAGAALLAFVQQATKPKPAPVVVALPRETDIETFAVGIATADITSPRGGALASDGEADQSFDLVVDGAVESIAVASERRPT